MWFQVDEKAEAELIRKSYEERGESKLEKLRRLDRKVKRPGMIVSLIFGIAGALVLGTGMCLAMKVIGDFMVLGIVVGCVGIAMVSSNYFLYRAIFNARRKKYAKEILDLSGELLGE